MKTSPRMLEMLAADLRHGVTFERETACERLGDLGGPDALALLISAMSDSDLHVRTSAAAALGAIRDQAAVPALVRAALEDHAERVRISAVTSLAPYRCDAVAGCLLQVLDGDGSGVLRMKAVIQLWQYDDPKVIARLRLAASADASRNVRLWAAESLLFLSRARGSLPDEAVFWSTVRDDPEIGVSGVGARALALIASHATE